MLDKQILTILVCPECQEPLEQLPESITHQINTGIKSGKISNKLKIALRNDIDGGFFCKKHNYIFPILEGSPLLLIDESILL